MSNGSRLLAVVLLTTILVACVIYFIDARSTSFTNEMSVEAKRVSPPGEIDTEIECDSLAHVELTYDIMNNSSKTISNLRLGLSCGCESIGSLPAQIDPGESARVQFRLRAPQIGTLKREVPVMADGISEPVLVLNPVLHVKFESPILLGTSQGLNITFIKGDDSPRELRLETIERKDSSPWIAGLMLSPPLELEILSSRMEELPEVDPNFSRRRYFFEVINHSLGLGERNASLTLKTRDDSSASTEPLPLNVTIYDSVAIVPNPVVFHSKENTKPLSKQVKVVYRKGPAKTSILKYDPNLILVRPEENSSDAIQAFHVEAVSANQQPYESEVVFDVGNGESRTLVVRYDAVEQ